MYVSILLDIGTYGLRDVRQDNIVMLEVLPLEEALARRYDCDARLLPYYFEGRDKCPRFTLEGLESLRAYNSSAPEREQYHLKIATVFLDIDPGTGDAHVATDDWRKETMDKLRDSALWSMGLGVYHTRNGIRGVIRLPKPMEPENAVHWQISCQEYLEALGVDVERVTTWNLPYRAPFVRRDGEDLDLPTENLSNIGQLDVTGLRRARVELDLPADPAPRKKEVDRLDLDATTKITENRNKTLFKIGCKLRRIGLQEGEIFSALLAIDKERCEPPLQFEPGGPQEIATAAKSAGRYQIDEPLVEVREGLVGDLVAAGLLHENALTGQDMVFQKNDDQEVAAWLLNAMGVSRKTLVHDRGSLRKYREGIWEKVSDGSLLKVFATLEGSTIRKVNRNGDETLIPMKLFQRTASSVTRWTKAYCEQEDFFSNAPLGVMFNDRFIRVNLDFDEPITIEEPCPDHRATYRFDFDFIPDPKTPLSDKMLETVLTPKIEDEDDLQAKTRLCWEFLGVTILGAATHLGKAILCFGTGNNGKSTYLEWCQACFPIEQVTHIAPQEMDDDYRMAQLADARLNAVEEMPNDEITSSAKFKGVVTGNRTQARHIRQAPFTYTPRAGHVFSINQLVTYKDLSKGFERRWLALSFERDLDDVIAPEDRRDYYGTWVARQEQAHIISKAVLYGIEALKRRHYIEPASSKRIREGWKKMSDQTLVFLEECCRVARKQDDEGDEEKGTAPSKLYTAYKLWAQASGHGVLNRTNFNERLKAHGYRQGRDGGGRWWNIVLLIEPTAGMAGAGDRNKRS